MVDGNRASKKVILIQESTIVVRWSKRNTIDRAEWTIESVANKDRDTNVRVERSPRVKKQKGKPSFSLHPTVEHTSIEPTAQELERMWGDKSYDFGDDEDPAAPLASDSQPLNAAQQSQITTTVKPLDYSILQKVGCMSATFADSAPTSAILVSSVSSTNTLQPIVQCSAFTTTDASRASNGISDSVPDVGIESPRKRLRTSLPNDDSGSSESDGSCESVSDYELSAATTSEPSIIIPAMVSTILDRVAPLYDSCTNALQAHTWQLLGGNASATSLAAALAHTGYSGCGGGTSSVALTAAPIVAHTATRVTEPSQANKQTAPTRTTAVPAAAPSTVLLTVPLKVPSSAPEVPTLVSTAVPSTAVPPENRSSRESTAAAGADADAAMGKQRWHTATDGPIRQRMVENMLRRLCSSKETGEVLPARVEARRNGCVKVEAQLYESCTSRENYMDRVVKA